MIQANIYIVGLSSAYKMVSLVTETMFVTGRYTDPTMLRFDDATI